MSHASLLRQYEESGRQLRTECERLTADGVVPAGAPWRGLFDAVAAAATTVEEAAAAPVKVGVLGEFSAGKTLLVGSLIGYADGLPVSELPTTGNLTALNFTLVEELVPTTVGPYRIEFLDHAGVAACLGFMLQQAKKRAKQADLPADLQEHIGDISATDASAPSQVEEWCRKAWAATTNPSMRYLIRELVGFVRAYAKCGSGLCESADPFEVEGEQARRGLTLTADKESIQGLAFTDLPAPAHAVATRPATLPSDLIRDGFPLIRRVSVDVTVSRQMWDFAALTGANRFVLMDFPGLGAESSGVRDLYLCLGELAEIQTILIVLNGRQPGGNEGTHLYNLLQEHRPGQDIRDMILVAVGRFDQLPVQNEGGETKLRTLAGPDAAPTPAKPAGTPVAKSNFGDEDEDDAPPPAPKAGAGPLTDAEVVKELPILGTCLAQAESLVPHGRKDRVVFASPMLHFRYLGEKTVDLAVGSPEFLGGNRDAMDRAAAVAKLWGGVAARLPAGPTAGLRRWLDDFATDGGIGRLRALVQSHVQLHGLAQRFTDVSADVEKLKAAVRELKAALPATAGPDARTDEDKLQAAEKELKALGQVYQGLAHKLAQDGPRFTVTRDDLTTPLDELLQEEVVFQVYDWQEWDTLLQSSRDGYIVETKRQSGPFADEDDDDGEDGGAAQFPTTSEHFFPAFDQTVTALAEFTRELVEGGVAEWLTQLAGPTAAARATVGPALERKTLGKEIAALRLGARTEGFAGAMRAAVDPARLRRQLFHEDGQVQGVPATVPVAADLFPLARAGKGSPGRVFGWAAELAKLPADIRPARHHAHQAMVYRLRDEVVNILRQEMTQLLRQGVEAVADKLGELLKEMVAKLQLATANRFVLETILRPVADPAQPSAATDPLADIRRVAAAAV